MNVITPEQFQALLPLACHWAEEQEPLILQQGVHLTSAQVEDARQVDVANPERVRLLRVEKIPLPDHPGLQVAIQAAQFISPYASAVTMRYGIFIRARWWDDRRLVVHELVHTAQYEKLGGLRPFLEQYLQECLTLGSANSPLEQTAVRAVAQLCGTFEWEE